MRLYSGTSTDFISDTACNCIAEKLKDAFVYSYKHQPSSGEFNSWRDSLRATSLIFEQAKLADHGVILEYQLPLSSKRIDCIITGRDDSLRDQAVIIELKQWQQCEPGFGDKVVTFVGGNKRDVLHPSVQVGQYKNYLEDAHTAFYEGSSPVGLSACAYLHNYSYSPNDVLFSEQFRTYLQTNPIYTADRAKELIELLRQKLNRGNGMEVLRKIERSKYRPSKKLLDHVGQLLDEKPEYILLDDQLVAFERVLSVAKQGLESSKKSIILIRGGPGTGKSVIALNLLARLSKGGLATHYVTGSKAFTATLKEIVGSRASQLIKNFSSYMKADADEIAVMICDEAHRMWQKSGTWHTPKEKRSGKLQIEELIHASRITVFFIDDNQPVRPDEIGSSSYVREFAKKYDCNLYEYELEAQFRCCGSDAFINWVTTTLDVEKTPEVIWNLNSEFEFKIFQSVDELDEAIRQKSAQGYKARMTAGFCWEWSKPLSDGTLVDDVRIGTFERPWNARPDAGHLAPHIPPSSIWAYDNRGEKQIGCIYTAQGFEFDYIGVIFGLDLVYRKDVGWIGRPEVSHDKKLKAKNAKDKFMRLVQNAYRVLLTRGMLGCYIYFMDKETEDFFRDHTESKSRDGE